MKAELIRQESNKLALNVIKKLLIVLLPLLALEGFRWAGGAVFTLPGLLGRFSFTYAILLMAWVSRPVLKNSGARVYSYASLALPGLLILGVGTFLIWQPAWAAWLIAGVSFSLLLILIDLAPHRLRWLAACGLAVVAGILPVTAAQLETRFSDEEFFAILQAAVLGVYWLLLSWAYLSFHLPGSWNKTSKGLAVSPAAVTIAGIILGAGITFGTIVEYQKSFYPATAPLYPGISEAEPFLCGQVEGDETVYQGAGIQLGILELVEAKPQKEPPEYGLLALGTRDESWLKAFKDSLLDEAHAGAFTNPAHSVKYGQYQATMRVYFYVAVREAFPELFSQQEENELKEWFAAINRRAQTVEWVDWMYALAFGMLPDGPYENQEIGAGLLSLMEKYHLGEAVLSPANQAYLSARSGGWEAGFRNSDDAIIYQPEWINNAYFQSMHSGTLNLENVQRSYEWLLLQSPPDGSPLSYNHIGLVHMLAPSYLGTYLTGDERLLWLAGRSLDYMRANDLSLTARPGMEKTLDLMGASPDTGSCLIYGDSGVPTKRGPLAPDKIVFRDGWDSDASYLLINLRFTGWHRYKATNTIVLLSKAGSLVKEAAAGEEFGWLPSGRSLFRDKRIPRENLNGLVIQRSGLSAVVYHLTSVGSRWAQDPPPYAIVERFETHPGYDISSSVIEDWHGWKHDRTIYFYHAGPTIVIDTAEGRPGDQSAILWHTAGVSNWMGDRLSIREGSDPAEMVLLPIAPGQINSKTLGQAGTQEMLVEFKPSQDGHLALVTVFLTGKWANAEVHLIEKDGLPWVQITVSGDKILIPIRESANE